MNEDKKEENPIDVVIRKLKKEISCNEPIRSDLSMFYCPIHKGFEKELEIECLEINTINL